MIRLRRTTVAAALLTALTAHTISACSAAGTESTPNPRVWAPIACASCTKAGVTVETRRSVDEEGRAGRYVFARVSNRNPHAVVFDLSLVSNRPSSSDPDFLMKGWRLALSPAGEASAATTLTLEFSDVAAATVSSVERF